jgi:hypothetical protein
LAIASVTFDNHALVAQWGGAAVIDLAETMVFPVGSLSIPTTSRPVVVQGDYAYVGNPGGSTQGTLHVVGISDPAAPVLLNSKILRPTMGLAISGDVIIVAAADYGAQVVTVTNPEVPIVRGTANTPGQANGVAIAGTNAFVADGSEGLQVVDFSVTTAPVIIGSVDTPGDALDVVLDGVYAYVVDGSTSSGLRVIDVSNPSSPMQIGNLDLGVWAQDVALSGDVAFVAQGEMIRIIDVSDPSDPQLLINFDIGSTAEAIAIHDNVAYVTVPAGVLIFDVSNPTSPAVKGMAYVTSPRRIGIADDFMAVTLQSGGLVTFPLQCADGAVDVPAIATSQTALHLDAVRPNPFRDGTSIEFSLPSRMNARLSIYDVAGRLIREFGRDTFDPGSHSIRWDGRDEQGENTAAGVYLIRLQGGGAEDVRRIVQIR